MHHNAIHWQTYMGADYTISAICSPFIILWPLHACKVCPFTALLTTSLSMYMQVCIWWMIIKLGTAGGWAKRACPLPCLYYYAGYCYDYYKLQSCSRVITISYLKVAFIYFGQTPHSGIDNNSNTKRLVYEDYTSSNQDMFDNKLPCYHRTKLSSSSATFLHACVWLLFRVRLQYFGEKESQRVPLTFLHATLEIYACGCTLHWFNISYGLRSVEFACDLLGIICRSRKTKTVRMTMIKRKTANIMTKV